MKTKNIFFSSLFLIAAYSCSLENETYDQLGSDNVMTTENDVKAAVTGIYHIPTYLLLFINQNVPYPCC